MLKIVIIILLSQLADDDILHVFTYKGVFTILSFNCDKTLKLYDRVEGRNCLDGKNSLIIEEPKQIDKLLSAMTRG